MNKMEGVVLTSVRGPSLVKNLEVASLRSLLYPDGLQDPSLLVVWLYRQDLCCIPIGLVSHVPCMHCNAILSIIDFDCMLMLCNSLLQGPSHVARFTIPAGDLVHYLFLLQFRHLGLHSCQKLSQNSIGFEDCSNSQPTTSNLNLLW